MVVGWAHGTVPGQVTGWSFGGGRVLPSRSITGPTAAESGDGGGGTGVGVGVGDGGVGWVIVVPYAGGVTAGFALASTRSARVGASSRRGTPSGGRPSRSSTWTKTFTDPRLCAAIVVDRLTYGSNIIETGTESYRLAQTQQQNLNERAGPRPTRP